MKKQVKQEKSIIGCYAPWLKGGIYAVTNIGVEILMHIQIFSWKLFLFRRNSRMQFNNKNPNKQSKIFIYFDETNKTYCNYC